MSYTRWWHSLLISFSVVTWGLAQPIYNIVATAYVTGDTALAGLLLLMLVYHVVPTALLFLIDRAIVWRWGEGRALRVYRVGLFTVATLVFLRGAQRVSLLQTASLVEAVKIGLVVGLTLAVVGLSVFAFRAATRLFIYLAAASLILTGVFIHQISARQPTENRPSSGPAPLAQGALAPKDPVFIVIFDGLGGHVLLRDGQIDAERFPHFAALGRDSAVFTNATSNYGLTRLSVPSFLTGRWFTLWDPRLALYTLVNGSSADSGVLDDLTQNGYRVQSYDESRGMLRSRPDLLVRDAFFLYGQIMVPQVLTRRFTWLGPTQRDSVALWDWFLRAISASRSPGQVYRVHPLLPHEPFVLDRYGQRHSPPPPGDAAAMEQAYEEQVRLVDNLLGRLTDKLKAEGLYERSVIVVTGDHGPRPIGALLSHPPQDLSALSPSVTMIIHGPRVRPQVSGVDYQHIDFRPTFWEALGGTPPEKDLPGVSAFDPNRPRRDKWYWTNWDWGVSWEISGGWFVYNPATGWWQFSPSGPP